MPLPKISKDCIEATKCKASQMSSHQYTKAFLSATHESNPFIINEMMASCDRLFRSEKDKLTGMAFFAMFFNMVKSQIESDDLSELFEEK